MCGYGPSVDKMILMAYLPSEMAEPGTDLQVMYMNELYPVKVVGTGGPFDPEKTMPNPKLDVAHQRQVAVEQQVVNLRDCPRGRVLYRE